MHEARKILIYYTNTTVLNYSNDIENKLNLSLGKMKRKQARKGFRTLSAS